jgi:hypothetical protein
VKGGLREVLSATVLLVALFLVLTNWAGFASGVRAIGTTYQGSVKVLQGR